VDRVPANAVATNTVGVGSGGLAAVGLPAVADALAGPALDAAGLLDVDVDQLAAPVALVALGGLEVQPRPSLPIPIRLSTPLTLGSGMSNGSASWGDEPQPPQRSKQLHRPLVGAVVTPRGRNGQQPRFPSAR
jgi:hypothetical protein